MVDDYETIGLTLRSHPLALLRPHLVQRRLRPAAELHAMPDGRLARYNGIVTLRQQPETANGTIFISLEETTSLIAGRLMDMSALLGKLSTSSRDFR